MGIVLPKQVGTEEGRLLFQKSEKVEDFDQGREIVDSLKKTLEHYGGVGLAAPQIGISRRVFVVNIMPTKDYPQLPKIGLCAYLNPEIIVVSPEVNSDLEGCLSIFYATLYGRVERSSWVKLKYRDIKGEEQIEEINHPFHTRVVLHENDHLDGRIFLQRMKEEDFSKLYWEENLDIRKRNSEWIAVLKLIGFKRVSKKKVYTYWTYSRWLEEKGQRYVKINAEKKCKKLDTFDFLWFTYFSDKTQKGNFKVGRKTKRKKFNTSLKKMNGWLKSVRNTVKTKKWWKIVSAKLRGHFEYLTKLLR